MTIILNRLSYQFGQESVTTSVSVGLSSDNNSSISISATIQITSEDIPDGKTLDDMTKSEFETLAKSMLAKLTAVTA